MRGDNTFIFLIVGIVILHFLIGIGWLIYKIMTGGGKSKKE
jgi:hypothetical protein